MRLLKTKNLGALLFCAIVIVMIILSVRVYAADPAPDTTPPVIMDMILDQDNGGVTITATDDSSGVKGIHVNNEFIKGDSIFYKIAVGTEMLSVMAEDNAGNQSPEVKLNVTAPDKIKPIIESVFIADNGKTLLVEASDMGGSGVKWITVNGKSFEKNPLVLDINGTKNFEITATDNAGNVSDTTKRKVDEIESSSSEPESGSGESSTADIKVSIPTPSWTNRDAATLKIGLSESGNFKVEARSGSGNNWEDISSDMSFIIKDNDTVFVRVTDDRGAESTVSKYIECFDRTKPEVSATQQEKVVKIFATDTQSGITSIYVNGNPYKAANNQSIDFRITPETKSIMIQSIDATGNLSAKQTFRVDESVFKEAAASQVSSMEEKPVEEAVPVAENGDNYYIVIGENTVPAGMDKMPIYIFPSLSKEDAQELMSANAIQDIPPVVDDPIPVVLESNEQLDDEGSSKKSGEASTVVLLVVVAIVGVGAWFFIQKKKQSGISQGESNYFDDEEDAANTYDGEDE